MKELIELQNNAPLREALRTFMYDTLKTMAGEKAMRGEIVSGFPEANLLIDEIFKQLDLMASK